jgi:nucleoside-diphosphate-sugar epimerase
MTGKPRRLFCFGLGYSARVLAARLQARGWAIAGTTRSPEAAARLTAAGIETHLFDRGRPLDEVRAALAGATHVLSSVPPDVEGDAVVDHHGRHIAAMGAAAGIEWLGYLSTTGVYGDRDGDWVDEDSALEPTGGRGRRRVAAEARWQALARAHDLPLHIFRLAGIYGPGRNAIVSLRAGTAQRIDKPGQVFSRVHVADIVAVLEASMARPHPGRIYNVCDDDPAPPAEVIAYASTLLGHAPPPLVPFAEAKLSDMARSFYRDNKRVRNDRIKSELGIRLAYPDYKSGLKALLAEEGGR